jgi:hypothetical protein
VGNGDDIDVVSPNAVHDLVRKSVHEELAARQTAGLRHADGGIQLDQVSGGNQRTASANSADASSLN